MTNKEREQMLELHNLYNKHEVIETNGFYHCRTCHEPLMFKYGHSQGWQAGQEYRPIDPNVAPSDEWRGWRIGVFNSQVVKGWATEDKHYMFERLFFILGLNGRSSDELNAILSCRDERKPLGTLREYVLNMGGRLAALYAKTYKDFGDDLRAAARLSPEGIMTFLGAANVSATAKDRIAASKDPRYAVEFAKNIDVGPHKVTRDGAARNSHYALEYAVSVDKFPDSKTSRGTRLSTIAMRSSDVLVRWAERFKGAVKPNDADRKAACRTKYGAFFYASQIDKGPSKEAEEKLIHSSYYGARYAKGIAGEPIPGLEFNLPGGWDVVDYIGAFKLAPSSELMRQCSRNSCASKVYAAYESVVQGKLTEQEAAKKSVTALAYVMWHHDKMDDAILVRSLSRNRGYRWIHGALKKSVEQIKEARASREKASKRTAAV